MKTIFKVLLTLVFFVSGGAVGAERCDSIFRGSRSVAEKKALDLAREVVALNKVAYDGLFASTGFKTYEDFVASIRAKQTRIGKPLVDMVLKGDLEFSMRAGSESRLGIARDGFHNLRVTGKSRGLPFVEERNVSEAIHLGMSLSKYVKTSDDFKPKYGYFRPGKTLSKLEDFSSVVAKYGGDVYVFKKASVADRATWTIGDSLGVPPEKDWSSRHIPWEYRGLMIPFLEASVRREEFSMRHFDEELLPELREGAATSPSDYTEIQFWGPLRLDDVEKFIFTGTPPKGEFLRALEERGIEIHDARENPKTGWATAKPWRKTR